MASSAAEVCCADEGGIWRRIFFMSVAVVHLPGGSSLSTPMVRRHRSHRERLRVHPQEDVLCSAIFGMRSVWRSSGGILHQDEPQAAGSGPKGPEGRRFILSRHECVRLHVWTVGAYCVRLGLFPFGNNLVSEAYDHALWNESEAARLHLPFFELCDLARPRRHTAKLAYFWSRLEISGGRRPN